MDTIGLIRTAIMTDKVIDVSLLMAIRNKQKMYKRIGRPVHIKYKIYPKFQRSHVEIP